MNYANTIADMAEQMRAERRKCEEQRIEMWREFVKRECERKRKDRDHA